MKKNKSDPGFTLVELLIVVVIVFVLIAGVYGVGVSVVLRGNHWFTEDGALKSVKKDHPAVTEIVDYERNVFSYSQITVKENGKNVTYYLDADILFNYDILTEDE